MAPEGEGRKCREGLFPGWTKPSCLLNFSLAQYLDWILTCSSFGCSEKSPGIWDASSLCCLCVCESLMERSYVKVTNMCYLGHISCVFQDWTKVKSLTLSWSCQDTPDSSAAQFFLILAPNPVFAISYSHKGCQIMFISSHCGSQRLFMTEVTSMWPNLYLL